VLALASPQLELTEMQALEGVRDRLAALVGNVEQLRQQRVRGREETRDRAGYIELSQLGDRRATGEGASGDPATIRVACRQRAVAAEGPVQFERWRAQPARVVAGSI